MLESRERRILAEAQRRPRAPARPSRGERRILGRPGVAQQDAGRLLAPRQPHSRARSAAPRVTQHLDDRALEVPAASRRTSRRAAASSGSSDAQARAALRQTLQVQLEKARTAAADRRWSRTGHRRSAGRDRAADTCVAARPFTQTSSGAAPAATVSGTPLRAPPAGRAPWRASPRARAADRSPRRCRRRRESLSCRPLRVMVRIRMLRSRSPSRVR